MKITLSKNQWEFIGKKTGWIKEAGALHKNPSQNPFVTYETKETPMGTFRRKIDPTNTQQKFRNIYPRPKINEVEQLKGIIKNLVKELGWGDVEITKDKEGNLVCNIGGQGGKSCDKLTEIMTRKTRELPVEKPYSDLAVTKNPKTGELEISK